MTWTSPSPKKEIHERSPGNIKSPRLLIVEAPTRIELVIEVLQTFALPLGYGAIYNILYSHILNICKHFLVTPTGIEPVLPP